MKRILAIAATSELVHALLRTLVHEPTRIVLVGRNNEKLASVANDLRARGADIAGIHVASFLDITSHAELVQTAATELGGIDLAIVGQGQLTNAEEDMKRIPAAMERFSLNATSVLSFSAEIIRHFEQTRMGQLVVFGSVAGDRGRGTFPLYAASKSAIATYLAGERHRLGASNVRILTVKPGFVDTVMTQHIKKNPLFRSPEQIAQIVARAIHKKRSGELYAPWFWWVILTAIKLIPERLFLKLKI